MSCTIGLVRAYQQVQKIAGQSVYRLGHRPFMHLAKLFQYFATSPKLEHRIWELEKRVTLAVFPSCTCRSISG